MVRFGIIGFGLHAVKRLVPGFRMAQNARLVALSRREPERAQASAREFGVPLAFDSAEKMCRSPEVDAVFVATPNACHRDDELLALKCGKPVLCEKPMGMNAKECREMVEAAQRARLPLGVAQIFRFADMVNKLRARVAAGDIGKVVFARSEFSFLGRGHVRTWMTDKAVAGGGPIADVGVHCIDTLRYLLQDEVARVHASGFSDADSGAVEAAANLSLEFPSGALGAALVSFRADYRTPLELVGEGGVLRAQDGLTVDRPVTLELLRGGKVIDSEPASNQQAYALQVDAFADAVEGKADFPAPGEEGWKNQLVLDAAYRSLRSGRSEEVGTIKGGSKPVRRRTARGRRA